MTNYSLQLKDSYEIADQTMAFVFEKPADFTFQAGQYVVMTLPTLLFPDDRRGMRSLSIASAPADEDLVFAMRITESGFKKTINALKKGDEVTITQALGHFTLPSSDARPIVFLIGGIGITPVRSILRQAVFEKDTRPFTLFFSNRRPEDAPFASEMQSFSGLHYTCVDTLTAFDGMCEWSEERGYICREMLEKYLPSGEETLYYMVGGMAFLSAMETMLRAMNVPTERIKKDPFTGI